MTHNIDSQRILDFLEIFFLDLSFRRTSMVKISSHLLCFEGVICI